MHINDILKVAVERRASDVHLKVGAHVVLRVDGKLQVLTEFKRMMQEDTIAMAFSMMSSRQKERFKHLLETDIAGAMGNERLAMEQVADVVAPLGLEPERMERLRTVLSFAALALLPLLAFLALSQRQPAPVHAVPVFIISLPDISKV